ncbi:MAG: tetratricopeptide repeat-containing sensor histidine kinase [Bacteroidales bacterium]|nr:tetratricopeptide repeat-containing sensor histidine kinase [Bacteroidales bacterium]
MKRLVALALAVALFPVLLRGEIQLIDTKDFIKNQYQLFEHERGDRAFKVAQTIMDSIGEAANFDADTDKDEIKAKLLKSLVSHYFTVNEFDEVFAYADIAIPFYREQDDLMNVAGCYHMMGIASQYLGRFHDAINYYKMCSDVMEEIGGPMADRNRRYEINNMASIYLMMEEFDMAEEMYRQCIDLLGEVGNDTLANRDLASYYQNLVGVWLERIAKMDPADEERSALVNKAVDYAEQSIDLSRRYGGLAEKMALRWITVSKVHYEAGREKEAWAEADSALVFVQEQGLKYLEAAVYGLKGDYAYRTKRYDEAERYYTKGLAISEENGFDEYRVEILRSLYLATKERHPERSIDYLERYKAWEDTIYHQEQQSLIREYQVKYQTAEKEREIAVQKAKNEHNRHQMTMLVVAVILFVSLSIVLFYMVRKRRRQNELLKRRNKFKDHLFSVVSHDIKTPVETQVQMLDMMCDHLDELPPDELKEGLEGMKKSANMLKEKLLNLICWVKGELGDNKSHPTGFNVNELTQSVIDGQSAQAAMKSLSIVNGVPSHYSAFDDANSVRLILQNLLSNAIKFSRQGGEIKLNAIEEGELYRVSVEDHGVGIAKAKLERLLKEMASPEVGTRGEIGTGIGLFVSRQLTDRMGSEISIESIENQGTKISFTVTKA